MALKSGAVRHHYMRKRELRKALEKANDEISRLNVRIGRLEYMLGHCARFLRDIGRRSVNTPAYYRKVAEESLKLVDEQVTRNNGIE